ncbi:MAG: acyl-CoA dehydrogenase [Candidatus Kapabacteria bacterium]|jgi:butyryl-CoA dehydrogenase|nr:acyl-CoA dehydrogenase [Candidatus Kapabacteria bacterium]
MDYLLTEEQLMLKDMVSKYAAEKIAPVASENERNHRYPAEIINELSELGMLGIYFPDEYGGSGMDFVSYTIAIEEISRHCASTGVIISAHTSLVCDPIFRFGTEEQKQKYLPDLLSGNKIGSFTLTEAGAGSDAGATQTTAKLVDDKWVLNGAKLFATNGKEAETFVLLASTDLSQKTRGISAFIVEKDTPGLSIGKLEKKLGIRCSSTAEIILEDVTIPKENMLGELNKGFKVAMVTLDGGRLGIASQALGIAKASIEDAVKYAKERIQFGRPIADLQAIQWMIADMKTEDDAAKLLVWSAATMKDKGLVYSTESAIAKLKASEVASFCANKCVQIHGGYGYTEDFNAERYLRDAKITEIYEGTSEVQRLVIARAMLK